MVDTHVPEVHKVILPGCHVTLEFHDLHLQVLLALLQSCEHTPGDITALLPQDVEGFVDVSQFIGQALFRDDLLIFEGKGDCLRKVLYLCTRFHKGDETERDNYC